MKSQLGGLRRKFLGNHLITTEQSKSNISQEKENNEIEWITLFRRNWHIYADMVLGIKLRPFQLYNDTDEIVEIESKELTFTSQNKPNA